MLRKLVATALIAASPATGFATGIPVIDVANLIQALQQVMNDITEINNQVEQIQQLRDQLENMTGKRLLGMIADDPALQNYVPVKAYNLINGLDLKGYHGLSGTAKALRDADMIYNCFDLEGGAQTTCQATLAQPYQQKGMLQDAMDAASGRLDQIHELMAQINATVDSKGVQEIQARIAAENALLGHEMTQIQMLLGMADSDERVARSRDKERQYEMLHRTGRIADYLH